MRNLILLLSCAPVLYAQQSPLALTLKRAVDIALAPDGNTRVQLALESITIAESRSSQSRAALLPNLDSSVNYQNFTRNLRAFGIDFSRLPIPGGFAFPAVVGPVDVYDFRLNATQSVFEYSAIRRYQSSRASVEAARAEARGTRDQVADQVARAYLNAIRAESTLETAQANVKLSEELAALAENQKNAGTGTGIELTRARVQLANDRQALEVSKNQVDLARLALLRAIGLRLGQPIELTDKMEYAPAEVSTPEEALRIAEQKRAELQAQSSRETSARLSYSAAKWERVPSLVAAADYGTIGDSMARLSPTRTVGLSLRVPLFDGGRRDARRAESLALLRQEQVRTRDVRQQVELEIRQALDSLHSAQAQYNAAREGLELADQEIAHARRRYQAGVTTNLEVIDAQARVERARENLVNALYNYNLGRIALSTATGAIQEFVDH